MQTKKKTKKITKKSTKKNQNKIHFAEITRARDLTTQFLDRKFGSGHSRPDAYFGIILEVMNRVIWEAPTVDSAMQVLATALDMNLEKDKRDKYFKKAFLVNIPD